MDARAATAPVLSFSDPHGGNIIKDGGSVVLIYGSSFFASNQTPSAFIGTADCQTSSWSTATSVRCQAPAGSTGSTGFARVRVFVSDGSLGRPFTFVSSTPGPTTATPTAAPTTLNPTTALPTTAPTTLTPTLTAVSCMVAAWTTWGPCSASCEGGAASRSRAVITPQAGAGLACPDTEMSAVCNEAVCPVNCSV